jgi:hypothetical protein
VNNTVCYFANNHVLTGLDLRSSGGFTCNYYLSANKIDGTLTGIGATTTIFQDVATYIAPSLSGGAVSALLSVADGLNANYIPTFYTPVASAPTLTASVKAHLHGIDNALGVLDTTSITGTQHQVLVNGTFGTPTTGIITLTLPQNIDTTSTPTFVGVNVGNIDTVGNTISASNSGGNIVLLPNGSGNLNIGSNTTAFTNNSVQIAANGVGTSINQIDYTNDVNGSLYNFMKSRSTTVGFFTTVQNGDILGQINAYGAEGTQFARSATIIFKAGGTISAGTVPGLIDFYTADASGNLQLGMALDDTQKLILTNPLLGTSGGTGINNGTKTITLTFVATGDVLTSDASGNATWQAPAYLTGAVLLSPSGSQTITANNLILQTGIFASGTPSGGVQGNFVAYSSTAVKGSIEMICTNNSGNYSNVITNLSTTAGHVWSFPDNTGTVALLSDIPASFAWSTVTGTSQAAAVKNGYFTNNAGLVTVTLPATAAVGDAVEIAGQGAGGWKLAANTGQTIKYINGTSTSGGSLSSTSQFDTARVICQVANTTWQVISSSSMGLTLA